MISIGKSGACWNQSISGPVSLLMPSQEGERIEGMIQITVIKLLQGKLN